jgi:hypothetical protein
MLDTNQVVIASDTGTDESIARVTQIEEAADAAHQDGEVQDRASIETLLARANECHLAATRADEESARLAKESTRLAKETGDVLRELKQIVGHGGWLRWLKDNEDKLGFSNRTARLYMQLAELPELDWQRVADLPLRQAMKAMAVGKPQEPTPTPSLSPDYALLVDACILLAGADVVSAYIERLECKNKVSTDRFDQAVIAVRRELAARP